MSDAQSSARDSATVSANGEQDLQKSGAPTSGQTPEDRPAKADIVPGRESSAGETEKPGEEPNDSTPPALKPLQIVSSVLAAALGVQSSRNRERDFQQGRIGTFIVAGLVATALFIGAVYTVVSLVLAGR